jgi:hypothetical protein
VQRSGLRRQGSTDASEYADVRDHPTRFFLVPGHEEDLVDRVVETRIGFTIVEKPLVP